MSTTETDLQSAVKEAKDALDAHTYEIVQRHFHESTGCPFWLEKKQEFNFDPLTEVKCYEDLRKFPPFEDDWLRGGPVERWRMKDTRIARLMFSKPAERLGFPKAASSSMTFASTTRCSAIRCPMSIFLVAGIG